MKGFVAVLMVSLGMVAFAASPAKAEFGMEQVDVAITDSKGVPWLQAGSHPFAMTTTIAMNSAPISGAPEEIPDGALRNLTVDLPVGFVGDTHAVQRCSAVDFVMRDEDDNRPVCPDATAVGVSLLKLSFSPIDPDTADFVRVPVYNLVPPPGVVTRLGFVALDVPVVIDVGLTQEPPYHAQVRVTSVAQAAFFYSSALTVWGDPSAPAHDGERGKCLGSGKTCPVPQSRAFLTLPRSCTGPLSTHFEALAWNTGETDAATALTEPGMVNCAKLGLEPEVSAQPTTDRLESPTGLDFHLHLDDEGLISPQEGATAQSDIQKAVVTLPEGFTVNPSQAEGLDACSEEDLKRETLTSEFGTGCPAASKIGTVEVESQLLEGEALKGSLFVAEPYTNRFGSLLAIYQVIKSPQYGIVVKLAGEVKPDPRTGQLVTTFENLPQLPFSDFRLRFREGGRSPLATPKRCGTYETKAVFTPWANPDRSYAVTSPFRIEHGADGGPCPSGALPFGPGFSAGTLNNRAASYSPLLMRLTRRDGDQDLTRFDATLPPGLTAKLAGLSRCSDAAIAQAKARTGRQELAAPSCPDGSRIGSVVAGAGVGSALTYVRGSVYLAGPLGKAPLSVVAVVPAVAGPFDIGTVVTRQALTLDPNTAQAKVDGALSDPIPHILAGIPVKVREIRVEVDRPNFTLNPTSCAVLSGSASLWGSGDDLFSVADDSPVTLGQRFQAADCAALGFKPRLSLRLKGGTARGQHPALRAELTPRPGDANIGKAVVALPRSAFLEQSHIRTICTRVQFAAETCPAGSVYGTARAFTPLLDQPLEGPVYLRSSSNPLPDLVVALRGEVDIDLVGRIDSVRGSIRTSFTQTPDAPVSKFVLSMQGGKKGLIVNSRDLCSHTHRASAQLAGQNGKPHTFRPVVRSAGCGKSRGTGPQKSRSNRRSD